MDKRLRLGLLLDWYGSLLTDRQRAQSLNEDCSLSEIAEREGVSRQAVRDAILRGEEQLEQYEAKLGFLKRDMELIASIKEMALRCDDDTMRTGLLALIERIEGNDGI